MITLKRQFRNEKTQKVNKEMTRGSMSLLIRDIPIKITAKFQFTL